MKIFTDTIFILSTILENTFILGYFPDKARTEAAFYFTLLSIQYLATE